MILADSLFLKIEFRLGVKVNKEILKKAQALTIFISSKAKEEAKTNGLNVLFRKGNILICRKSDGSETEIKSLRPRVSLPAEYDLK